MSRKILSLTLVLSLILSCVPIPVFAATKSFDYIGESFSVKYEVTSEQPNDRYVNCIITNTGSRPIENWVIGFPLKNDSMIGSIWNGTAVSHEDDYIIVKNSGWNANIAPGSSVSFGFNHSNPEAALPEIFELCKEILDEVAGVAADFEVTSDWGTGFSGLVILTNNGVKDVGNWSVSFGYSNTIQSVYGGVLTESGNGQYSVKNGGWNALIPAGGNVSFEVMASGVSNDFIHNVKVYDSVYKSSQVTPDPEPVPKPDPEPRSFSVSVSSPEISLDADTETYQADEALYQLVGIFNTDFEIASAEYTLVSHFGTYDAVLAAEDNWLINDILLGYGQNTLQFRVLDENGFEYTEALSIINFNTERYDNSDSDSDAIVNWEEDYIGTDKLNPDTDSDGISDGIEYTEIFSDPLVHDSGDDNDNDGLTNAQEVSYGTDTSLSDTDGDLLTDGDEINVRNTDPLDYDTDADGLSDADEFTLGLDPLDPVTDGVTPDAERVFEEELSEEAIGEGIFEDNEAVPSITLSSTGVPENQITVEETADPTVLANPSVIGKSIDISLSDMVEGGTIAFEPEEARPLNEVLICRFDSETLELVPLETSIDTDGNITAELDGAGSYFLMDVGEFLEYLDFDIDEFLAQQPEPMAMAGIMAPEFDMFDVAADITSSAAIDATMGAAGFTAVTFDPETGEATEYTSNPESIVKSQPQMSLRAVGTKPTVDVIFLVDTTSSMMSRKEDVFEAIRATMQQVSSSPTVNVDARFAVAESGGDSLYSVIIFGNGISRFNNATEAGKLLDNFRWGLREDDLGYPSFSLNWLLGFFPTTSDYRHVVFITDEDYRKDPAFSYETLLDNYVANNVALSAVVLDKAFYGDVLRTGGAVFDLDSDFASALEKHLTKPIKLPSDKAFITLKGWLRAEVDKFPDQTNGVTDTDKDGLPDSKELIFPAETMDIYAYVAHNYSSMAEYAEKLSFISTINLATYDYKSNPVLLDTDYDGIPDGSNDYDGATVTPDARPRDNTFSAELHWNDGEEPAESKNDLTFMVNYSLLASGNKEYKNNLSMLASLYATDIYQDTYVHVSGDINKGSDNTTDLWRLFGMKDIENIKLNANDYSYYKDDITEFVIGHRNVTTSPGVDREVILVSVRGTNGTNAEWSSNFDVGADTDEYYAVADGNYTIWRNKENHKGFDVAANRVLERIEDYLSEHSLDGSEPKSILITGHSRGAAIANLLGAHFEDQSDYLSFTYTFAAPNVTTYISAGGYRTIFNIVNEDDLIPYLPLMEWDFFKYGRLVTMSVRREIENRWGSAEEGSWEWLTGTDYNNDSGKKRTLDAFLEIAGSREELYVLDSSSDGTVYENVLPILSSNEVELALEKLEETLEEEKLLKYCNLRLVGNDEHYLEVNYSPAYLMQMLANMASKTGPTLGHDVKGKYAAAKASFVASSGELVIGGMTHPHQPITYCLIAHSK